MKFLKHILTAFALITLASCQSVDYYGKSYEKNGFFHCMMLEYAIQDISGHKTEDDKINCINYKEKLAKNISQLSLHEEKKYYERNGAICDDNMECIYRTKYAQNVMYDAYVYRIFLDRITIKTTETKFEIDGVHCDSDFSGCNETIYFSKKPNFTILKKQH